MSDRQKFFDGLSVESMHTMVRDHFCLRVSARNDRAVLSSVLQCAMNVFFSDAESESGFELSGSACVGGLWYGSDVDLRYMGSDMPRFFALVSQFVKLVGAENDFYWTGRLLTIDVLHSCIKVDILVVGSGLDAMYFSPALLMDGVCFKLVNLYNIQHARFATRPSENDFCYDAAKTAALERVYQIVINDPDWHAFLVLLKSIDTKVPTCMLAVIVGFASYAHWHMAKDTDKWCFGMELVNRFLRAFAGFDLADEANDVQGANDSFFTFMWEPFARLAFADILDEGADPMPVLFTRRQREKLQQSCLGAVICEMSCPAEPSSTPMFSSPRLLSPYVVHHAVDYIIASCCLSEIELRQSAETKHGLHQLVLALADMWDDNELAAWLQGFGAEITGPIMLKLSELMIMQTCGADYYPDE